MKNVSKLLAASGFAVIALSLAATTAGAAGGDTVKRDNSAVNKRDRQDAEKTADTQMQSTAADVELTRQIRQELVGDKALSTYAQNIKIITVSKVATLKGPVDSQSEKEKVADYARRIVGPANVVNEIEVVSKQ